jgi:hypothetical protein
MKKKPSIFVSKLSKSKVESSFSQTCLINISKLTFHLNLTNIFSSIRFLKKYFKGHKKEKYFKHAERTFFWSHWPGFVVSSLFFFKQLLFNISGAIGFQKKHPNNAIMLSK